MLFPKSELKAVFLWQKILQDVFFVLSVIEDSALHL